MGLIPLNFALELLTKYYLRKKTLTYALMRQKKEIKREASPFNPSKISLSNPKLLLWLGAIIVVTYVSFSPVLKNNFVNWDDNAYVFENPHLNKPLPEAIRYFFGPNYFIGNYIPLTMLTYAIEHKASGLKPEFYHMINLFFHLLNVILVFSFIYLLSGRKALVAGMVSLFFGIHPMHVESVAWVSELKDVQYTFFFLAGLIVYYKYLEKRIGPDKKNSFKFLAFAFLLFILSVLSKPAAIIFPLVLLLLDFYTQRKFDKLVWMEKIPFFILSIIFGFLAIQSQKADRLLHEDYAFSQKLFFASHSFISYLVKFILPTNLSLFSPYPTLIKGHLPTPYYLAPALVILLVFGVYKTLKHSRLVAFGFLFFAINLILVLQFISIGDAIMADRYTYIPYVGLLFMVAMGFDSLYQSNHIKLNAYKPYVVTLLVVFVLSCFYLTFTRCKIWKNQDTIATDLLNKFPDDRLALNNKGFLLSVQGRYEESIKLYERAIQLKKDYSMAYINLMDAYLALNNYNNALSTIDTAIKHVPNNFNLITKKAYLLFRQQNYSEAVKLYKASIVLEKNNISAYSNLAECYYMMKEYAKSINTLNLALARDPSNFMLLNSKGYVLFVQGKFELAVKFFKASLNVKPDYTTASVNLSDC